MQPCRLTILSVAINILLKLRCYTIALFCLRNLKRDLPCELGNTEVKILPSHYHLYLQLEFMILEVFSKLNGSMIFSREQSSLKLPLWNSYWYSLKQLTSAYIWSKCRQFKTRPEWWLYFNVHALLYFNSMLPSQFLIFTTTQI